MCVVRSRFYPGTQGTTAPSTAPSTSLSRDIPTYHWHTFHWYLREKYRKYASTEGQGCARYHFIFVHPSIVILLYSCNMFLFPNPCPVDSHGTNYLPFPAFCAQNVMDLAKTSLTFRSDRSERLAPFTLEFQTSCGEVEKCGEEGNNWELEIPTCKENWPNSVLISFSICTQNYLIVINCHDIVWFSWIIYIIHVCYRQQCLGGFFHGTSQPLVWDPYTEPPFLVRKEGHIFVEHMYLCEYIFICFYIYTPGTYILEPKWLKPTFCRKKVVFLRGSSKNRCHVGLQVYSLLFIHTHVQRGCNKHDHYCFRHCSYICCDTYRCGFLSFLFSSRMILLMEAILHYLGCIFPV